MKLINLGFDLRIFFEPLHRHDICLQFAYLPNCKIQHFSDLKIMNKHARNRIFHRISKNKNLSNHVQGVRDAQSNQSSAGHQTPFLRQSSEQRRKEHHTVANKFQPDRQPSVGYDALIFDTDEVLYPALNLLTEGGVLVERTDGGHAVNGLAKVRIDRRTIRALQAAQLARRRHIEFL